MDMEHGKIIKSGITRHNKQFFLLLYTDKFHK